MHTHRTLPLLLLLLVTIAPVDLAAQDAVSPPAGNLLEEPDRPLDERIDPARVTEGAPPSLPEQVVLPLPPEHAIARQPEVVPISEDHWKKARLALAQGLVWLRKHQHASGGWMVGETAAPTGAPAERSPVSVAVTALAIKALAQADGRAVDHVDVRRALRYVLDARQPDGSFEGGALTNYVTSAVVSGLAAAGTDTYADEIAGGTKWLGRAQWDQTEGVSPRQDWFGGAGYGNRGRPDLSNTQMMLEAMYDAGMSPDEPAVQRALAFVSRAQNHRATNPSAWAGNDGGFVYTPANGGESMASEAAGEGRHGELIPEGRPRSLRSYGSMTYAGFKSLLYAGMSADDDRVRACFEWIRRHWTFDENPGLGPQGLYYYYHAMARALRIAQQHTITDAEDATHNWREELIDAVVSRQKLDGSWVNDADRWLEGEPELATVHALLALEEALKPVTSIE